MALDQLLRQLPLVVIRQKKELAELFGFETRNKYSIETQDGRQIAYAAEQQKGIFGFIFRQMLGHWRTYSIHIFGADSQLEYVAHHPFRFYYQRLDLSDANGRLIGSLERRFEIFTKCFDMVDPAGNVLMTVRSPLWRIWTFKFKRNGEDIAVISKKWTGILTEMFLDADNFFVEYSNPILTSNERLLLLAAGIFIDLRYFEEKANKNRGVPPLMD